MSYYIFHEGEKAGPFTIEELHRLKINPGTQIWRSGSQKWEEARDIAELQRLFSAHNRQMPPVELPDEDRKQFYPATVEESPYLPPYLTRLSVYDDNFSLRNLTDEEVEIFSRHHLSRGMKPMPGLLLHYLTMGIFTFINCGLKHDHLPKIKSDDFGAGKAFIFMFIPFFNLYWQFRFWGHLAARLNFQLRLRGYKAMVSKGLATTICILNCIPWLGWAINILILLPILGYQVQLASNKLAENPYDDRYY